MILEILTTALFIFVSLIIFDVLLHKGGLTLTLAIVGATIISVGLVNGLLAFIGV